MDEQTTIEDQKQMVDHLHKRVREHMKEKNCLIEMNTELENELIKKEKQIKEVSKYHKNSRDEYKEALAIMEKKREVSNNLIKSLQLENNKLEKRLATKVKTNEEFNDKLSNEIEELQKVNKTKEIMIKEIVCEKEMFEEKLKKLENENDDLKENLLEKEQKELEDKLEKISNEKEYSQTLSEELGISDHRSTNVSFECDAEFAAVGYLNNHKGSEHDEPTVKEIFKLKLKEMELEKHISSQKLKISSDLIELKEKEISEERRCRCRGFCRIVHQKHNWRKSYSQIIIKILRKPNSTQICETCDKTFENVDSLKKHMETVHKTNLDPKLTTICGGEKNGGVIVVNPSCSSGGRLIES